MEGPQDSARPVGPLMGTRGHGDMGTRGTRGTWGLWGHPATSRPLPRGQRDPMALKGQCAHLARVTVASRPFLVDMGIRGTGMWAWGHEDTRETPRDITLLAPWARHAMGACGHTGMWTHGHVDRTLGKGLE